LGAFNRAGKTVTKIGIYSKPPPKWSFYGDFIISRPNFNDGHNLSLPRQLTITIESPRRNILTYTINIVFLRMFRNLLSYHLLGSSSQITSHPFRKTERIARDNS
jgi:hypothetical protein